MTEIIREVDPETWARAKGFHVETVRRFLRRSLIPGARKIGGRWRIPLNAEPESSLQEEK